MNRAIFSPRVLIFAGLTVALSVKGAKSEEKNAMEIRQIIAHRGSSADRPENTLASLRRAIESGATAVEVDVRRTNDGHLVMLHDPTLDRTTDGSGNLDAVDFSQLRKLDAGVWFDEKFKGEKVPTLQEVVTLCRGKIDVLLDLKQSGDAFAKQVASEVKRHGDPVRTIVGVRSIEQAHRFRHLLPTARQLGLIPDVNSIEAFSEAEVEMIRLWLRWLESDPTLGNRVRDTGAMLHVNGRTGQREEVVKLLKFHPDSLSSDDPAQLVKTLSRMEDQREEDQPE